MNGEEEDDVALTLVHTADWHLGRRFLQFHGESRRKLSQARLEVVERLLDEADHARADAVLCAGDLFDEARPEEIWWQGLSRVLSQPRWASRPIFLLPGNHDPLMPGSVWEEGHPFRSGLPPNVHVVDRDDFAWELKEGAVLHAAPCRSFSTTRDLAMSLPARAPGDDRIRIGMVHGSTFDMKGCQANFPIAKDAVTQRGFDYLAIGDTHSFRVVPPDAEPPTVYPGAPEPTSFEEDDAGHVALVLVTRRRTSRLKKIPVARWHWERKSVRSMDALRALERRNDLGDRVLALTVEMTLPPERVEEAERILHELEGTEAMKGRVGVLLLEKTLRVDVTDAHLLFENLPEPLKLAATRLQDVARSESRDGEVARRALLRLYELARVDDPAVR